MNQTKELTQETIQGMAAELEVAATNAVEIYTTGLQAEAATNIAALGLSILMAAVVGKKVCDYYKRKTEIYATDDVAFYTFASAALTFAIAIPLLAIVADQVVTLAVPEYRVIADLTQVAESAIR